MGRVWPNPPLVGREPALAEIRAALTAGTRPALVVCGPPGVGRSRLLRETADLAEASGWTALRIRASASATRLPFAGLVQALPMLGGREGVQLLREAAAHLEANARDGRACIVVDDAHLLDGDSTAALVHLALIGRALVVCAWPSGEGGGGDWETLAAPGLDLEPLSPGQTRTLLAAADPEVSDPVVEELHAITGGLPLYLVELVRGGALGRPAQQVGLVRPRDGTVAGTTRLRDFVVARLAGTTPAARAAVEVLAYAGPVPVTVLEGLGIPAPDLLAAEAAQLLLTRRSGAGLEAELAHPLLGELIRARQSCLHQREIARGLCAVVAAGYQPGLVRAACWRLDAEIGVDAEELVTAARCALAGREVVVATRLARAAVAAGSGPATGLLAELLIRSGDSDGAHALLVPLVADALSRPHPREAHLPLSRLCAWHARNLVLGRAEVAGAQATLARAWEQLPAGRAVTAAARADLDAGAGEVSTALTESARVIGDGGADSDALTQAWAARCLALTQAGRLDDAAHAGRTATRLYREQAGDSWSFLQNHCLVTEVGAALASGRLDRAAAIVEDRLSRARAAGWLPGVICWSQWWAAIELERGLPRAAAARLRTVDSWDRELRLPHLAWLRAQRPRLLAVALAQAGDAAAAEVAAARLTVPPPAYGSVDLWGGSVRGWLLAARGLTHQAVEAALADAARAEAQGRLLWCLVALHQGVRFGHADLVLPRLLAIGDRVGGHLPTVYLGHAQAAAQQDPVGLAEAAARYQELGMHLAQAEALTQAAHAHELAHRCRAAKALRTRALLAVDRCDGAGTPLLATLTRADALTPRQREIAELAWSGLSSRQIADRLSISPRTVDNTLGHTYRKLDICRREELGALFEESKSALGTR